MEISEINELDEPVFNVPSVSSPEGEEEIDARLPRDFNLGKEAIGTVLAFESHRNQKLFSLQEEAEAHMDAIEAMLQIQSLLASIDEDSEGNNTVPEHIQTLLQSLHETHGIDLRDLNLKGLKSALSSKTDHFRMKIQQQFNKMQTILTQMGTVHESAKEMRRRQDRLMDLISQSMSRGR